MAACIPIVAGKKVPCVSCRRGYVCRVQPDLFRQLFFAIGKDLQVECSEYEPRNYHGLEGVLA